MERNERKEVTNMLFKGVAADGGFVFEASVLTPNTKSNRTKTVFKVTTYAGGVMEIAIDYTASIQIVAELVAELFSKKSNFANLDSVILNYRNIRLQFGKNSERKDIIFMLMKVMSKADNKASNVSVDTQICQKRTNLKDSNSPNIWCTIYTNSFYFDGIVERSKSLCFRNTCTGNGMMITSLKDGIATVDCIAGETISGFTEELRKFFVPYSNFYGVKAIMLKFEQFAMRANAKNLDKILGKGLISRSKAKN